MTDCTCQEGAKRYRNLIGSDGKFKRGDEVMHRLVGTWVPAQEVLLVNHPVRTWVEFTGNPSVYCNYFARRPLHK